MNCIVEKKTGTYSDALHAIGVASLLEDLGMKPATIHDIGACFTIATRTDTDPAYWSPVAGFPYVWEQSSEPQPAFEWILDYESERKKREAWRAFREARKSLSPKVKSAIAENELEPEPPVPELAAAVILNSMRKGWNGDRDLAKWIASHCDDAAQLVRYRLGCSAETPACIPSISNTQVLNPISGKGVHGGKTRLRSPSSVPNQLVDPFAEWMKIRAFWLAMLPFRSGDDFKFFVIEPADIEVAGLKQIKAELSRLELWGGLRLDIAATLRTLQVLLLNSDAFQAERQVRIALLGRSPRKIIAGLRQAFFKSLGNAAALLNDAFLPMPDWFGVESRQDAMDYMAIIEEAIGSTQAGPKGGCLNSLDERNSDDGRILQRYREWLLTGDLFDLLDFHHAFAVHLMQQAGAGDWVKPFSAVILDMLLAKSYEERHRVKEIIENPGFRSIARAVRNTTIYALSIPNSKREVRFGLAQRWKQKIKAGDDAFSAELAEFVQEQNWEVVHRLDGKGYTVSTDDLDQVLGLIHTRHAELVGSLLLAYGFAQAPKVETDVRPETEAAAAAK